jgi:hypothetical protein
VAAAEGGGEKQGSSPPECNSSRYFFTSLSQRNVFVLNIKGHVSQSKGYAACCHWYESKMNLEVLTGRSSRNCCSSSPQRSLRSWRIPSAQPCWRRLSQRVKPAGQYARFVPPTCLLGHGLPTPSYQVTLRHKNTKMLRDRVSSIRRQPSHDPLRRG